MKTQTVYTVVPEKERLPMNPCNALIDDRSVQLDKHENVYFFTKEQLEERDRERDQRIAGEAFDAGVKRCNNKWNSIPTHEIDNPDKSQYLINLKTDQP